MLLLHDVNAVRMTQKFRKKKKNLIFLAISHKQVCVFSWISALISALNIVSYILVFRQQKQLQTKQITFTHTV